MNITVKELLELIAKARKGHKDWIEEQKADYVIRRYAKLKNSIWFKLFGKSTESIKREPGYKYFDSYAIYDSYVFDKLELLAKKAVESNCSEVDVEFEDFYRLNNWT